MSVLLNFTLDGVSLVPTINKPFDMLAEWLKVSSNRGDWQNFEREVQPYAAVFLHGPQPHILRIGQLMRQTA